MIFGEFKEAVLLSQKQDKQPLTESEKFRLSELKAKLNLLSNERLDELKQQLKQDQENLRNQKKVDNQARSLEIIEDKNHLSDHHIGTGKVVKNHQLMIVNRMKLIHLLLINKQRN